MEGSGTTIPIKDGTLIVIRTSADLYLSGTDGSEVQVFGSEERVQIRQEEGVFRIENHSGMDLNIPRGANVRVERVGGNAFLKDIGSLDMQKVGGDMALQRADEVQIGRVGGNLTVLSVSGSFRVQKVGGDLLARELNGKVTVEGVGGNGDVQAVGNEDFAMRVGGDALVFLTRSVGRDVSVYAGGNADLFLPSEVNARFDIHAGGEDISLHLNRQATPIEEQVEERHYSFTLGGGDGRVQMYAGGDCQISDETREPSSLGDEFNRLENSWQNARENRERYGWPGHFDPARSAAWSDMVERRAQEAVRRAEMRAQSASRRAEEHARRAEERVRHAVEREGHGRGFSFTFGGPTPPPPPKPPASPVTEQERLMILTMLQENKITVEQAEALLRALEGGNRDR